MADPSGQLPKPDPDPSKVVDSVVEHRILGAMNGNVSQAASMQPKPRPVFTMKRTGHTTLPLDTPLHSPSTSKPPTPATSHGPYTEPSPVRIVSDILPPKIPSTPTVPFSATPSKTYPATDSVRKTKYATDEQRREATSRALKERWASGRMDHVHKKRIETMRRRKEEEAKLANSGVNKASSFKETPVYPPKYPLPQPNGPGASQVGEPTAQEQRQSLSASDSSFSDSESESSDGSDYGPLDTENMDFEPPAPTPETLSGVLGKDESARGGGDEEKHAGNNGVGSQGAPSATPTDIQAREHVGADPGEMGREEKMVPLGHSYSKWKDVNGVLQGTYGALLPEGYQFSAEIPGHPWICPLRTCRRAFPALIKLGGHFNRAHRGVRFHDNEDGTFSVRDPPRESGGPIVASKGPADPLDPPPVAASFPIAPQYRKGLPDGHDNSGSSLPANTVDVDTPISTDVPAVEQGPASEGDPSALWGYLEPFLVKHKGPNIPTIGWVRQLLPLPRVRDLDWNTAWLSNHPYNDTHPRDISALIVQVTGEAAPQPCERCSTSQGPFRSCVMISSRADNAARSAIISCGNCFYHFRQSKCSHRFWGATRRPLPQDGGPADVDMKDVDSAEALAELEDDEKEEASGGSAASSEAPSGLGSTTPMTGNIPAGLYEAEPGRPYTKWPDEHGNLITAYGCLLPAGYQFDTTYPNMKWVCPVRDCRMTHSKLRFLGFHFERTHWGALFNDNRDGTLTVKGTYGGDRASALGNGGKILIQAPPIVVSNDILTSQTPLVQPRLRQHLAAATQFDVRRGRSRDFRAKDTTAELWAYVKEHLASTTEIPGNSVVKHLFKLPKQRDVPYNTHHRAKRFEESQPRDVAAMLIQITGDEAEPGETCKRCLMGKGPFKGCIYMAAAAHDEARKRYPCCANCLYGGHKLHCTVVEGYVPPYVPPSRALANAARRGRREGRSIGGTVASPAPLAPGTFQHPNNNLDMHTRMEDWEVAPGRIMGTTTAGSEGKSPAVFTLPIILPWRSLPATSIILPSRSNLKHETAIAYSKLFLSATSSSAIPVDDGIAFRVNTIVKGQALALDAELDTTRLCAVASGKVKVKIGEEPEFAVGPHGLFKVKAGTNCTARNEWELDAVVFIFHVQSLP
ncbi:hypothetical protein B0J18DRAFT_32033 [Chaetomium sp. MPI-SDFR-AT-0129]|nr:hypothetical protein B0J18DRAFT_32033 [Chaetomium sp. MPI-SDFR-AT-0129]